MLGTQLSRFAVASSSLLCITFCRAGCISFSDWKSQLRVLVFLSLSTHESRVLIATSNRSGLQHVATALRSLTVSALSGQCLDRAGRRVMSNMPSADSCTAISSPPGSLSLQFETRYRPPQVSSIAFPAHLPDLQPWPLMDLDFAIHCPLVRPRMPHIRFPFPGSGPGTGSRFCSTLPSDGTSR